MIDRALLASDKNPKALLAVEEAVLHLGSEEDRVAAQRVILRAQDAHRMELPGATAGFIWIACLRLNIAFLDGRSERAESRSFVLEHIEADRLWRLLDKHVRDLSKDGYIKVSMQVRPNVPTWPGIVLQTAARCASDTRAWIGFHCVTNMISDAVAEFSTEGSVLPGPLMVCAAIPDASMRISDLQDASRTIPDTPYAQTLRERLQSALQQAMSEMPQLKMWFDGGWHRMSNLVEQADVEAPASSILANLGVSQGRSVAQAVEGIRAAFPGELELVCGSTLTIQPAPGQAVLLPLYAPNGGRVISVGFAGLLPGTALSEVAKNAMDALANVGLQAKVVVLEALPPIQRLTMDSAKRMPCVDGVYRNMSVSYFGKAGWGFKTFDWESGWNFDGPAFQSDEAFRKLGQIPHPIAMQVAGVESALAAHYEVPLLNMLHAQMLVPGRACGHAIERMKVADPSLEELDRQEFGDSPPFEGEWYSPSDAITPPNGVYCASHWKRAGGALMVVRQSLMERLEETSIEKGFPVKNIKLTYPDIYFHFEKPLKHFRQDGISFILTGFYASEEVASDDSGHRTVAIDYTYLYGGEVMRIGALDVSLVIGDDDSRDLTEVITERRQEISRVNSDRGKEYEDDLSSLQFANDTLAVAAKVLLYTTLKNARMVEVSDRSRLVEQLRNIKGNKRDKMRARIAVAFDYIAVGPEESQDTEGVDELRLARALEAQGIKPHWRRGFYRTQHYGEGRKLTYSVWIPPVLVNGHLINGAPPARKDYVLN